LQQFAEKALKAYLTGHSVRFGKTHDLSELLRLASAVDAEFGTLAGPAEVLTPFAVEVRYPGDWDELSREEYAEVRRAAEEIACFVSGRFP
jgi:HEPN domain-containing protein